jgi:hypothetical protein
LTILVAALPTMPAAEDDDQPGGAGRHMLIGVLADRAGARHEVTIVGGHTIVFGGPPGVPDDEARELRQQLTELHRRTRNWFLALALQVDPSLSALEVAGAGGEVNGYARMEVGRITDRAGIEHRVTIEDLSTIAFSGPPGVSDDEARELRRQLLALNQTTHNWFLTLKPYHAANRPAIRP